MKTNFPNKFEKGPKKSIKSPWNFDQPAYDERSSCYMNAGSHHGVGYRQPVGHKGDPKQDVPCLPKTYRQGMKVDEQPRKNLPIEIEE